MDVSALAAAQVEAQGFSPANNVPIQVRALALGVLSGKVPLLLSQHVVRFARRPGTANAAYCVTTSSVTSSDRDVPSGLPLASVAFPRMVMLVTPVGVTGVVGAVVLPFL